MRVKSLLNVIYEGNLQQKVGRKLLFGHTLKSTHFVGNKKRATLLLLLEFSTFQVTHVFV